MDPVPPHHPSFGSVEDWARLTECLAAMASAVLAGWLVERAAGELALQVVLRCEASQVASGGFDGEALQWAVHRLTEIPSRATWRDADWIGDDVALLVGILQRAVDRGFASPMVEILELAMSRVERVTMEVQDIDAATMAIWAKLLALHRSTCALARVEPARFAERWFQRRLNSPLGLHDNFPADYLDIIGAQGLETLRKHVDQEEGRRPAARDELRRIREELDRPRSQPLR